MNKVSFVIPLHEKHYSLAQEFMQSFKKYNIDKQADLHFVLSTQQDSQSFDSYMQANPIIDNYGGGGGKVHITTYIIA